MLVFLLSFIIYVGVNHDQEKQYCNYFFFPLTNLCPGNMWKTSPL